MAINLYLGKPLKDYTYDDLKKLKRKQLLELFYQLDPPGMSDLHGEYRAAMLNSGPVTNTFSAWLFLNCTWGTWQHKAFEPLGKQDGHGYNTFITTRSKVPENYFAANAMNIVYLLTSLFRAKKTPRLARIMLNKTSIVSSVFDGRPSFQLSYKEYNSFFTNTMTDELRTVNDKLYLGVGRLTVNGGKNNPTVFALSGPPAPWVGPDIPYPELG
ncbi:MAG: hypothetical protein EPN93_17700 [Spirochaetes bacterium]|nr:MAG: hypothetical protein EPN93_17700 [Spirochaetota bacterium]